jgi:hypothetical protein
MDEHCRITVVGGHRQVDLAVPAHAPITTYVNTLARLCGQETNDILPPAWSLATATGGPFAPERSLAELGIVDGQILHLRDVIADEFAEPVVYDVGERVTEVADGILRGWDAHTRTITVMLCGLGWLITTLIVLASRRQVSGVVLGDSSVVPGLVLPALAWTAAERRWPVPLRLREILSLNAVPALALAGWVLASSHLLAPMDGRHAIMTPGGLTMVAIICGALIGAFLAFTASPSVTTCAVLLAAVLVALVAAGLAMLKASGVESAAVVAVAAYALLTIAPGTVSWIVTFADRTAAMRMPAEDDDEPLATAVRAATTLLVLWSGGLAAVIAAALVALAASRSLYAAAEVGCLAVALVLRAGAVRLVAEVVPVGLAGAIGLFALLLVVPGHLGWRAWTAPALVGLIAVGLLIYGFRRLLRNPELPPVARPRWLTGFSSVLAGGSVAFAVASFSAYSLFVRLGHHL